MFNKRLQHDFTIPDAGLHRVYLLEESDTVVTWPVIKGQGEPVRLSFGNRNANIYDPIMPGTLTWRIVIQNQGARDVIDAVFDSIEGDYRIEFYQVEGGITENLIWRGDLLLDQYNEDVRGFPGFVELVANDLGKLQGLNYLTTAGFIHTGRESQLQIIKNCVDLLGYDLGFACSDAIYEDTMDGNPLTDDPMLQAFADNAWFYPVDSFDQTRLLSAWDVLKTMLISKACRIRQWGGRWYIEQILEGVEPDPPEETGDFIVTDGQFVVEFKLNSVDPVDISDGVILYDHGSNLIGSRFCTYMLNGYKAFSATSAAGLRVLDDTNTQIQDFAATINGISNASYNELGQVTVLDVATRFSHYNADASLNNSASVTSSRLYGGVQSIFDGKFYYMNNEILQRRDTLNLAAGFEDMQHLRSTGGTVRGSFSANKFGWMCIFTPNNSNANINTLALVGPPPHSVRKWKFEMITLNTKAVVITDENRIFVTRTETGPLHYLDERSFDTGEVLHTYDITTQIGAATAIVPIGGMRYFDKFHVLVIAGKIINANTGALIHDTGYGSNGRCDIFPTDNTIRAEFIAAPETFSTDFSELDDGVIWYQDTWLFGWIQFAPSTRYSVVSDAGYTGGKYLNLLLNTTNFGMVSWDKVGGSSNDFSIEASGVFQIPSYVLNRAGGFVLHASGQWFNATSGSHGVVIEYIHGIGLRAKINTITTSTFTSIATDGTIDTNITGRFHIKVALTRTNIKARFWLFGDAEPLTWNIDTDYDFSGVRMGAHGVYFAGAGAADSETRVDQIEFQINQ